jgi:hypothetical protein
MYIYLYLTAGWSSGLRSRFLYENFVSQSISGVNDINPLVAFYDIHGSGVRDKIKEYNLSLSSMDVVKGD